MTIEAVTTSSLDSFIEYLNDHLADNGVGGRYFQPLPENASRVPPQMEEAFRSGVEIPVGNPGWSRQWVARSPDRKIIGHIGLRARLEPFAEHRCLLGMGVDCNHRRSGVGAALLSYAEQWAATIAKLEWIDLQVLSGNAPAIRLYLRTGFTRTGELPEMFRIDGQTLAYTSMSKRLVKT